MQISQLDQYEQCIENDIEKRNYEVLSQEDFFKHLQENHPWFNEKNSLPKKRISKNKSVSLLRKFCPKA